MSRLITRTIGASVGLVATLAWSSPSRAQDGPYDPEPASQSTTSQVTPKAADVPRRPEEPPSHSRTAASLMLTGILTLGASYGPAAYVASESALPVDRKLQIPFAGPWIDLVNRPGCSVHCGNEPGYQALLLVDGFFQVLAGIELFAGVVELTQDDPPAPKAAPPEKATVRVTPTALGPQGYGLAALGKF